jgi:hypothetical protein
MRCLTYHAYVKAAIILIMIFAVPVNPLFADEVTASRLEAGVVHLEGKQFLSNGCFSLGSLTEGTPDGAITISNALSITLEIRHSGDEMCAMMISEPTFYGDFQSPADMKYIVLYRQFIGLPETLRETKSQSRGVIISIH